MSCHFLQLEGQVCGWVSELKRLSLEDENRDQADCGPSGVGQLGAQGVAVKKLLKPKARRIAVIRHGGSCLLTGLSL